MDKQKYKQMKINEFINTRKMTELHDLVVNNTPIYSIINIENRFNQKLEVSMTGWMVERVCISQQKMCVRKLNLNLP